MIKETCSEKNRLAKVYQIFQEANRPILVILVTYLNYFVDKQEGLSEIEFQLAKAQRRVTSVSKPATPSPNLKKWLSEPPSGEC